MYMLKQDLVYHLNNTILRQASKLVYRVSELAPSTEVDLFNSPSLVIWSGASEHTIFQDSRVNWSFRALHDVLHLKTRYSFNPYTEMALGRIQANQYSGIIADIIYAEVAGQAEYFLKTGQFVLNQVEFTLNYLKNNSSYFKLIR